jgi:hypothetical protein
MSEMGQHGLKHRNLRVDLTGIACDPNGTFVAMRADFDIYSSPVAIDRTFFEAGPVNLLGGREWAMLIDANLLVEDARTRVRNALLSEPNVKL